MGFLRYNVNELLNYAGELSERIFGVPRISTQEAQGYVDRFGRTVEPRPTNLVSDVKVVDTMFGIGAGANDEYAAGSIYSVLTSRQTNQYSHLLNPDTKVNFTRVLGAQRTNEIIFRCLRLIMNAAVDPKLEVQREIQRDIPKIRKVAVLEDRDFQQQKRVDWDTDKKHPVARLLRRPNKTMTGRQLIMLWLADLHTFGKAFVLKKRDGLLKVSELWRLDPRRVHIHRKSGSTIKSWRYEEYDDDGNHVADRIYSADDIIFDRFIDSHNPYFDGVSPTAVALNSTMADIGHTDFIRQFFDNWATPKGILVVKNKTLTEPEADLLKRKWYQRFSLRGGRGNSVAVLDQNAEYQAISSKLDDLDNQFVRAVIECRLCMVFGVPPVLAFTFAGIDRATYTNSDQSEKHFWSNTLLPIFRMIEDRLTWSLLNEFETEEDIVEEKVRLNWNYEEVRPLQEDKDKAHERARLNVKDGLWTVAEGREATGAPIDPYADYYIRQEKMVPSYPDVAAADAAILGKVPSVQVIATPGKDQGQSAPTPDIEGSAANTDQALGELAKQIDTSNPQADAVQNATPGSKQTKPN